MDQKTTKPIPTSPGRKINPKMTTNRSMLVAQGGNAKLPKKGLKKKPLQDNGGQILSTPSVNTPVAVENIKKESPQAVQPPVKRGGANMTSNPATGGVQTRDVRKEFTSVATGISDIIVEDTYLEEDDKVEICKFFTEELGLYPGVIKFLNESYEETLNKNLAELQKDLQKLAEIYSALQIEKEEEKLKQLKQSSVEAYTIIKKATNLVIKMINDAYFDMNKKYQYFKELINLVNENPFGEVASIVHKAFYVFSVSLMKAGFYAILKEDFSNEE
jgi:hypothetical protein